MSQNTIGDLKNNYEKLRKNLLKIKYPQIPSNSELYKGNPEIFLQILNYSFVEYSQNLYNYFLNKNYELFSKNDMRFLETIYQIILKECNYKPVINISQFFSSSFYEVKLILVNEIIETIVRKNNEINPIKKKEKVNDHKKLLAQENVSNNKSFDENSQTMTIPQPKGLEKNKKMAVKLQIPMETMVHENKMYEAKTNSFVERMDDLELEPIESVKPVKPHELEKPTLEEISENFSDSDKENQDCLNFEDKRIGDSSQSKIKNHDDFLNIEEKIMAEAKHKSPSQSKNNKIKKQDLLKMIFQLNENQQSLLKKFDLFQTTVNKWVSNTNAQMFLLDNNLKMIKNHMESKLN